MITNLPIFRIFQIVVISIFTWFSIVLILTATKLRPIADDYCAAAIGEDGVLTVFKNFYFEGTGDVSSAIVNFYLTGQSLIHLPFSFASLIPYFLSLISITFFIYVLINLGNSGIKLKYFFILFVFILPAWISYWWATLTLNDVENIRALRLANTVTFWQSVNIGYVFMPFTISSIILVTLGNQMKQDRILKIYSWNSLLFLLLGFVAGTSGLVYALTIFIILILFACSLKNYIKILPIVSLILGLVAGVLFSITSPGSQGRQKYLSELYTWTDGTFTSLIAWIFPSSVFNVIENIYSWGALTTLIVGIIFAFIIQINKFRVESSSLLFLILILFSSSLIISVLMRLGESRSYPAFWHEITFHTITFIALFLTGVLISNLYLKKFNFLIPIFPKLIFVISSIVIILFTLSPTLHYRDIVNARYLDWEKGGGFIEGPEDRTPGGWTEDCWIRMENLRSAN
jgi:hypothetical protein